MSVLVTFNDSTVLFAEDDDSAVLDLVAHFLGIATYHNDNNAPTAIPALKVTAKTVDV
ncbi:MULTISPECIES: hypothetical protein [Pacificibacter]|uniref:hypothetical protein n=1 Tax=Pacificibacter TaxID=1042323 RepID=UPI001C08A306|nr:MULTISPECIES: hypothetical protein [Pacificibacter]MBU2935037.1 hypothetical protein [Pacificibacter marinus]MDO6617081.1 hypothetical protein [Pacificibacter sp. 1_MG-2023]